MSSFVSKQSMHKKVNVCVDTKVKRIAMHSKLVDALSFAKRLRQRKNSEKKLVLKKYKDKKSLGMRILSDLVLRYKQTKINEVEAAKLKIKHIFEKNESDRATREAPSATVDLLSKVHVFCESRAELGTDEPAEPMICDDSIKLSKNELLALSRGPKFLVRSELYREQFNAEMEKMVFKQKFEEMSQGKDDSVVVSKQGVVAHSAADFNERTRLDNSNINIVDKNGSVLLIV